MGTSGLRVKSAITWQILTSSGGTSRPRSGRPLAHARVVLVNGPRQAGKTTLVGHLPETASRREYLTLDEAGVLAAARRDPAGFVAGLAAPVVIDAVQRTPELFVAIKGGPWFPSGPGRTPPPSTRSGPGAPAERLCLAREER